MAIAADFSVSSSGDIRYTGTGSNYTVIEFHRWLGDLMDDAQSSGDDILDITDTTASERSTDNIITLKTPYNIDGTASQHLYDGSIIQNGGDDIWDGILVFSNPNTYLQIVQNGALATNFWTSGLNADAANGISHRFMLKVRTSGSDIDGRRIIGQTREFNKTYSEFKINGTSRGNNVLALTYADDLNNQTVAATVAGYTDIVNVTEGYNAMDVNDDTANEYYYSEWDKGSRTINQFYERMKWMTRRGTTASTYGINGELFRGITHEINVDTPTGTFNSYENVSWSGGTGLMLAINSPTAATKMWIQLLTGVVPTNNQVITGDSSGATVQMDTTITERTLSFPFVGQSTGTALIGAYGLGVEEADLASTDKVFDLTNTQVTPPNNVTFTVAGLVSGDRVLVTNDDGGAIDVSQFTLNGALTGAAVTSVVVNGAIPTDTPSSGTIRVLRANGVYSRHAYTSWSTSTFTIGATDFSSNNAANGANCYISYIDTTTSGTSESFTVVYSADRTLFIRVRDGGVTPIKTFETTGSLGSAGGSSTAIRTSDE